MGLHISNPVREISRHKISKNLFQYRIFFIDTQSDYVCDFLIDNLGMLEIDDFLLNPTSENSNYINLKHRIIYNDICQIHSMIYDGNILRINRAMRLMLDRSAVKKFKENITKKVFSIRHVREVRV